VNDLGSLGGIDAGGWDLTVGSSSSAATSKPAAAHAHRGGNKGAPIARRAASAARAGSGNRGGGGSGGVMRRLTSLSAGAWSAMAQEIDTALLALPEARHGLPDEGGAKVEALVVLDDAALAPATTTEMGGADPGDMRQLTSADGTAQQV
jgi:hypothetical protein